VRDGLKPVHRRILYAMHELGLSPRKPHRKSARVVGEVLGKFHPHGDQSVYDALVRMAQDFSLRTPLVDGHGNFGSMDGDSAAAMRYTECRLQPAAADMLLADLESDTVPFAPNFDDSTLEPAVLPAKLPNLLINGSQGIAVGMATNIPPHNLREVAAALEALIDDADVGVDALMARLPAPDFPTGGQIVDDGGLRAMYRTGNGRFTVRGVAAFEKGERGRHSIVITELPYGTNKASLAERIAELADDKKLEGVSGVRDESDRDGMRLVVEVKRSAEPQRVLHQLYKLTGMETRFAANMIAIHDGEPKLMGMREMLRAYLDFRFDVVQRRTRHALGEAERRLHRVQGFVLASVNAEEIIRELKESTSAEQTHAMLERLGMSRKQAEMVLEMPLRRLSGLELAKLREQAAELEATVAELSGILADDARVMAIIREETASLAGAIGTERRTAIVSSEAAAEDDPEEVIEDVECIVTLTEMGYLKRMSANAIARQQRKGTKGHKFQAGTSNRAKTDNLICMTQCSTMNTLLLFADTGKAYRLQAHAIPEATRASSGERVTSLLSLPTDARVQSLITVHDFGGDASLVNVTRKGLVQRTALGQFENINRAGIIAMKMRLPGDKLCFSSEAPPGSRVAIATAMGKAILISVDDLRQAGRSSSGVKGISITDDDDEVVACDIIPADAAAAIEDPCESASDYKGPSLLVVSSNALAKRVPLSMFREQSRGGVGVKLLKLDGGTTLAAIQVTPDQETIAAEDTCIIVSTKEGIVNCIPLSSINVSGRQAKGHKLVTLNEGDAVHSITLATGEEARAGSDDE